MYIRNPVKIDGEDIFLRKLHRAVYYENSPCFIDFNFSSFRNFTFSANLIVFLCVSSGSTECQTVRASESIAYNSAFVAIKSERNELLESLN